MPNLTTLITTDNIPCTCCGCPACAMDEEHGPLCAECMDDLAEIEDFLEATNY